MSVVLFERARRRRVGDMHEALQQFLESPTARNYRRVREALLDQCGSEQLPGELAELAELAAAGEFACLLRRTEDMQPAWALSPRVHYYAALAAAELGDADTAAVEKFAFSCCLEGLLATGDGTPEAPYLITYISDAYDVLTALGLEPRSQMLVEHRSLLCDVLKCADGEEIWFELSGVLGDPRQVLAHFAPAELAWREW